MEAVVSLLNSLGNQLGKHWIWLLALAVLLLASAALVFLLRSKPKWLKRMPHRFGPWSRELLRSLRYLSTRREWRYGTPWTLLVGDAGSGKSSIRLSITSGRRSDLLLREACLAVADSEWDFFDGGVVIDIHDQPNSHADESDQHWKSVLNEIDAQRPERPLDSVVLTISAKSLLDPSPGGLQALANRSYQRLFELQKRFSFTFPVYILVTQCDRIDGFSAFWSPHAESRHGELFGWSNPFSRNQRFDADWVDETFKSVREGLHMAQLDAAAHHDIDDPDAFFLFPQRFSVLHKPLRTVLELIFQPTAYHEDFLVRGIYFSGRIAATEKAHEDAAVQDGNTPPVDDVAFVDDLFNERVFCERNLARPTTQGVLSRNRLLRRVQIGMLTGTALLFVALTLTAIHLDTERDSAIAALNAASNPDQILETGDGCNRGRIDAIYMLLGNLASIRMNWSYPAIPASWFDEGITTAAAREIADSVFKDIIFPSLRCRLENRAQTLITAPLNSVASSREPAADVAATRTEVDDYLNQVRALEDAIRNYRFITANSAGDSIALRKQMLDVFSELAEYAYGEPLPSAMHQHQSQLARTLSYIQVNEQPLLPENFRVRVHERLDERLAQARNVIRARIADGATLAKQIEDDVISVDVGHFANWLNFAHEDWLSTDSSNNPCAQLVSLAQPVIEDLIENFGYTTRLRDGLARFGHDPEPGNPDSKGCFVDSLRAIQDTNVPPYGSVTVRVANDDEGPHLQIAPWVNKELAGLKALRDQNFINASSTNNFSCQAPLSGWDGSQLAEAVHYAHEYQSFREQHNLPSPQRVDSDKKPLFDRLARRRLHAVLDERLNRAQKPLTLADTTASAWLSPLSTGDVRLGNRSRGFALTAPQLQMVLGLYAQFGMDAHDIQACARSFAASELDAANRLAEASDLYEPDTDPAALEVKSSADAPPYFELGSSADTKEYLQQQLQRARVLAGYTKPFVRFLQGTRQVTVSDADSRKGSPYWQSTVNEIDRYVQGKDTKGQVATLHNLMEKQLRGMNQANCADALPALHNAGTGQGLFHARRTALTRQVVDYCNSGNTALARGEYRDLAKRFNTELAGLFPFGPPNNPDASLAVTKRFFLDYAAQRGNLRKKINGTGNRWQHVNNFLNQLDAVADFFQPSLAAGPQSRPLDLNVTFRYLPQSSHPTLGGESQLISWRFGTGDAEASYPNGNTSLNWRFGDPISLQLIWAELSAYRPEADDAQPHLKVNEREASFSAGGPWALLRLIETHRNTEPGVTDPLNDDRVITAFSIPLKFTQPPGATNTSNAKLHLALDLVSSDKSGKPGAQLSLPTEFPSKAPYLW